MDASKGLGLFFAVLIAIAPQRANAAPLACDDDRLPRVNTSRYEHPSGRGFIQTWVACRAESAPYSGPRGDGMATLITQRYTNWSMDVLTRSVRLFLVTPDNTWREINGIKNTKLPPVNPDEEWRLSDEAKWRRQIDPKEATADEFSIRLTGDPYISNALLPGIPLVQIEEDGANFCFSYSSDYPFIISARSCSSGEVAATARLAANVVPVQEARRIAAEAWFARHGPPKGGEVVGGPWLFRITDEKEPGRFRYEFAFPGQHGLADLMVTVDGLSRDVRVVMRPCKFGWWEMLRLQDPEHCLGR